MKSKINNLSDLKAARLEAKLRAEKSRNLLQSQKDDLKDDLEGISSLASGVKSAAALFSGPKKSGGFVSDASSPTHSNDDMANLLMGIASGLSARKIDWRPLIFSIVLWSIKSGYLEKLVTVKKSDVYALLLTAVRDVRKRIN